MRSLGEKFMKQISTLNANNIIQYLDASELIFFLAIKDIEQKTVVDILRDGLSCHDNILIHDDNGTAVTISIFILGYNYPFKGINTTVERLKAVNLVFKYWKEIGKNKSRTKDPYNCHDFMKYLDSINFRKADYLIIGKP